jgi:polyhydroxyalkanoate synthesis regulator phasin
MVELTDGVMPILKNIQKELGVIRGEMGVMAEDVREIKEDIGTIKRQMTYHMGITMRHRSDFEDLHKEVSDLKSRVDALESRERAD